MVDNSTLERFLNEYESVGRAADAVVTDTLKRQLDENDFVPFLREAFLSGWFLRFAEARVAGKSATLLEEHEAQIRDRPSAYDRIEAMMSYLANHPLYALGPEAQKYALLPVEAVTRLMEALISPRVEAMQRDHPEWDEEKKEELDVFFWQYADFGYCWRIAEEVVLHVPSEEAVHAPVPIPPPAPKPKAGLLNPTPPVAGQRLDVKKGLFQRLVATRDSLPPFRFSEEGVRCSNPHFMRTSGDHLDLVSIIFGQGGTIPGYQALASLQRKRCPTCPTVALLEGVCDCCKAEWKFESPLGYSLERRGNLESGLAPKALPAGALHGLDDLSESNAPNFDTRDPGDWSSDF